MIIICILLFVILLLSLYCVFSSKNKSSEHFAYPFLSIRNAINRRRSSSPCVQGCVIQTRRGVFIDKECESMCRNWYTPVNVPNTNYGYEVSSKSTYDPKSKQIYLDDLKSQVSSNKSAMQFSTIGQ